MPAQPERLELPAAGGVGILCALREELGGLAAAVRGRRQVQGLELLDLDPRALAELARASAPVGRVPAPPTAERRLEPSIAGAHGPILACVCGVGKVHAARAAALLIAQGAQGAMLVVGTCGGLRSHLAPGSLVHCTRAIQADFAMRHSREAAAHAGLLRAWSELVPGSQGAFLTADRPVLSAWRRWRVARHIEGPCVADMETAAAAASAQAAGVPWAALRAVTDQAGWLGGLSFQSHYPVQAGRAADTIPALLARLSLP